MPSFTLKSLFFSGLLALLGGQTSAQVVISEVMVNPSSGSEWIELTNVSSTSVNLSKWCLFVATRKQMGTTEPGNYWFPFPKTGPGSVIPAGGIVVVQWLEAGTNQHVTVGNYDLVFTGTTVFDFLFGLWHSTDMALPNDGGAIGLVRSQDPQEVITPGFWADFFEYGSAGFLRESIPHLAGIWTTGDFVPLPSGTTEWPVGDTIAYSYTGNSSLNYWRDRTPTKGMPNSPGASVNIFGEGCACLSSGNKLQCTIPVPAVLGSFDFKIVLNEGIPQSAALAFLSNDKGSYAFRGCNILLNPAALFPLNPPVVTDNEGQAIVPLFIPPSPVYVGASLYTQFILASPKASNGLYCASNGVLFTIGQ